MSIPTTTNKQAEARAKKRGEEVALRRRSGNGTIQDVAEFFCRDERTVRKWKDDGIIGHTQIGGTIWFSEYDVAEVAKYHKFGISTDMAASSYREQVRKDWCEFLGKLNAADELASRVARLEQILSMKEAA